MLFYTLFFAHFHIWSGFKRDPLVAQTIKNLPAMWETWVQPLGWEDPLEKGITIHSSIPAWRIPRTRGAGRLYSSWGYKELDMTERLHFHFLSEFKNNSYNRLLSIDGIHWLEELGLKVYFQKAEADCLIGKLPITTFICRQVKT